MIVLPFLYFSFVLSYILFKKRGFDISAYVISLYTITSFFAILVDINNLRSFDTIGYQISLLPSVLYCSLLTLTIWPFYQLKTTRIAHIKLNRPKLFNFIIYFYFGCFLLILASSFNSIIQILTGNLVELRSALYKGESITNINIGGVFKPLFIIANIFGSFSIIMILFYFYSITYLHRSKLFNAIILLSSISIILIGIIGIDRSKVFYWMVSYGFCLVLFWPRLNKKQHKGILIVSGLILSAVMLYFLVLTFSRFDIQDTGGGGSMISYGGQAFINFSFFFDKVNYREFTLQRIFPLVYKLFVDNGIQNTGQLNEVIGLQTGKNLGVFSTFIGDIMVACGRLVAILYCIIFYFLSRWLLGKRIILNFYQLVFLFCLITVPMLGIFVDYYAGFEVTIPLICFLIYAWNLRFRHLKYITQKKLKLKNNEPPILD